MAVVYDRYTAHDLARMSPDDANAWAMGVPGSDSEAALAELAEAVEIRNFDFITMSQRQVAPCIPQGARGNNTLPYRLGGTHNFDVPVLPGATAFRFNIWIEGSLTYTPAGTGPTIAMTAAGWNALFDRVEVHANGKLHETHLQFLDDADELRGTLKSGPDRVLAGYQNTTVQNQLRLVPNPPVSGVNAGFKYMQQWELNMISPHSVAGALPISNDNANIQIRLRAPSAVVGPDPKAHVVTSNGTFDFSTLNIRVSVEYMDGFNFWTPNNLWLDLTNKPTIVYGVDNDLPDLTAGGQYRRQRISTGLQHYLMIAYVIDGRQSTQFCLWTNLLGVQLTLDESARNTFYHFWDGADIGMDEWFRQRRNRFQQDFPREGTVDHIVGWAHGTPNPDNRDGKGALNMWPKSEGGFYGYVGHGYKVGAVGGVAGVTPRVELYYAAINPDGLVILGSV